MLKHITLTNKMIILSFIFFDRNNLEKNGIFSILVRIRIQSQIRYFTKRIRGSGYRVGFGSFITRNRSADPNQTETDPQHKHDITLVKK